MTRLLPRALLHLTLLLVGLAIAVPIVIAVCTSLKPPDEIITFPPRILPQHATLDNYVVAWRSSPFGRFLLNSAIQSAIIVSCEVVFAILAASAFAFLEFPGNKLLFALIVGSLMVPTQLTFIPNYLMISKWRLANTYAGLTLPFLATAFGVFLLRQFFLAIPRDLRDSVVVDGAGHVRFVWAIAVPISKGSISTLAIYSFLNAWNQYLWPLIVTDRETMRTVQIAVRYFMAGEDQLSQWGVVMAAAVIVALPTLALFLVAQRRLVEGIAMAGLKG
jgi:sn-glycerol 3-phosphate transport system permease protein